jgi:hypothetical protein
MNKYLIVILLFSFGLKAQTKKPVKEGNQPTQTLAASPTKDTIDPKEVEILQKGGFSVYTRRGEYSKDGRAKLCVNLVGKDIALNYCSNDSICRDPEVYKILFQKVDADTTYMLIYVDAFTKFPEKSACDAGHETKLIFVKWNTVRNKAEWKQRTISSCMKAITNMTKEPVLNWDGASPLVINYHRGRSVFVELRFDPLNYAKGIVSNNEAEAKN